MKKQWYFGMHGCKTLQKWDTPIFGINYYLGGIRSV